MVHKVAINGLGRIGQAPLALFHRAQAQPARRRLILSYFRKGETMKHYHYLIVGGGMTAAAALEGIREVDADGSIGLLTADSYSPYDRPPLSKKLWKAEISLAQIMRKIPEQVDLYLARTV